jgi:hypothetical protein
MRLPLPPVPALCVRLHALDVSGVAVLLKSTQTFTPAVPDWHMCAAQLAGPSLPGLLNTVTGLMRLGLVDVDLAGTRAVGPNYQRWGSCQL